MSSQKKANDPFLSIVIPAYNEAKTIHLILDKVINTELINNITKEIIIINDCSKDNSVEICRNWINENSERFFRAEIIYSNETPAASFLFLW